MGAPTSLHPTDQTLSAYGLGKLDDASAEAVNAHLESCPDCRRRTSEMTSDSFLGRFQGTRSTAGSFAGLGGPFPAQSLTGAGASIPAGTLPPGLADHRDYKVVRELGRGGMGVVYLAENTLMGRMEVLKVMARQMTERPEVLDRFLREIRSVARLRHPNIVAAYHAFRVDKSLVFAMEHVDGFDLARMVKSRGPLPVAHACLFAHQTALGLQHAHEEGMVHRDIKPGNLMVSRRGDRAVVKVLDFGLAKAAREGEFDGALTHEGQMLGTPDFIAPEQIVDAQKADIRADIYSLGCTLYYLLNGGPPFHGSSLYDLFQAHHSMDARPLNFARPEVPSELAAIVAKMMAKEPERRFRTPAEVSAALVPFTKKGSVALKPAKPAASRVATPAARRPVTPTPTGPSPDAPAPGPRDPAEPERPEAMWSSLIDFRGSEPKAEAVEPVVEAPPRPRRSWPAVAAGTLLLGFLAAWMGGVIKIKTADGTIVLEGLPDDAETFVDGKVVKLTAAGGVKPFEFSVAPGTHKIRVRHGDRTWDSDDIVVAAGARTPPIHVFLEEVAPPGSGPGALAASAVKSSSVPLFNGKDLTGWNDLLPNGSEWKAVDGILEGRGSGKPGEPGVLVLQRDDLKDFRLRAKVRHRAGNLAWIELRRTSLDGAVNGYAVAVGIWPHAQDTPVGSIGVQKDYRYGGDGGGWSEATPTDVGAEEWYDLTIDVHQNTVTTSLNGKEVGKYTDPEGSRPSGGIALGCSWNTTVEYRSITLEESPDRDDRASSPGERADSQGWKPLFNGKDLADFDIGWADQHRWSVVDGTIVSAGPGTFTVLHTKRHYSDFHLRLETMLSEGVAGSIDLRWEGPLAAASFYAIAIAGSVDGPGPQKTGNIQRWIDGKRADVASASDPPAPLAPGRWFPMEIVAVGDTIRVLVEGREVARYMDPERRLTSGPIGLFCRPHATMRFRNIQIKERPAPSGG